MAYFTIPGNRPPQASPPYLRGETTVTLTPAGVVQGPVAYSRIEIWDPEGDRVSVEGHGLSPAHASNLSMVLGSLVMMYFSDAADYDYYYCRAVPKGSTELQLREADVKLLKRLFREKEG